MGELIYKKESYQIIGACMEVQKELGKGFREIIYGDSLEIEFKKNNITYSREKRFSIKYKGETLPQYYIADFIIDDKNILEIKAIESLTSSHLKQTLNYFLFSCL